MNAIKISDTLYKIPIQKDTNLDYIYNLKANTLYKLLFNDLTLNFLTDNNGTLYINNKKQPLPIGCIPYNTVKIEGMDATYFINIPKIKYSTSNMNFPCPSLLMEVDLVEIKPNTRTYNKITRTVKIENGILLLIYQENYIYKNILNGSSIAVL